MAYGSDHTYYKTLNIEGVEFICFKNDYNGYLGFDDPFMKVFPLYIATNAKTDLGLLREVKRYKRAHDFKLKQKVG